MTQQTAVEWLVDQIKSDQNEKALSPSEWIEVIEQAKQMEKKQIMNAFFMGRDEITKKFVESSEQYYNETYNKKD